MVDSIPSYHLDMIANGLVSTSPPTLGPLLGVPLSWTPINPQERSFRNKQSHHMLWGWVVDSIPSYHLDMTALGLVSTSPPTLGPLLGVPLSWTPINPQERSFRNKQSHHMLWGWVVDSIPSYHLDMTALVAKLHKSGDSSKHPWVVLLPSALVIHLMPPRPFHWTPRAQESSLEPIPKALGYHTNSNSHFWVFQLTSCTQPVTNDFK